MTREVKKELIEKAVAMLAYAYVPYSGYTVGAALLCDDGKIYTGCNIENAAYTPTNCAERTAFFKAVSEGERSFSAIAVVGGKGGAVTGYFPPCGVCRQVMMEFCDPASFTVLLWDGSNIKEMKLEELLPLGFGPSDISE